MTQPRRLGLALATALALSSSAMAGDLVARLPAGAQLVAYLDLAAWRSSGAVASLDAARLGSTFGVSANLLQGLGEGGRFDRLAIGGFPVAGGKDMKVALLVDGAWDRATLTKALLADGAVEVAVAGQPSYRLPKDADGDEFVLSFLEEGRLAVSDWDLAEPVRAGGAPLSPVLAQEVTALPAGLSAWVLIADPLDAGAANGLNAGAAAGLAQGVRSLAVWARAADVLELGASALARDTQQATQLGAMLQLGLLGLSSQGGGEWSDVLSTLRFDSAGERLSLACKLGPEQVARLATGLEGAVAPAVGSGAR